jgi:hypothetical protein
VLVTGLVNERSLLEVISLLNPVTTEHELIRVGSDGDGGYLIPNDLEGISACFSPGVADTADFESDIAKLGIPCFLADYSVSSSPIFNDLFDFEKKYLGVKNDNVYMRLEDWIKNKVVDGSEFILQMDIEGAEYRVILDTPLETLKKFRILVVEFHGIELMGSSTGFDMMYAVFEKISSLFDVVHIHPNNYTNPFQRGSILLPGVIEVTFLRSDRSSKKIPNHEFPHSLDVRNVAKKSDLVLPDIWHSNVAE